MTDEPKRCPFCGGAADKDRYGWYSCVDAFSGADNPDKKCFSDVILKIEDWNTRPIEDALTALLLQQAKSWQAEVDIEHEMWDGVKVVKTVQDYEEALATCSSLMDAVPGSFEESKLELLAVLIEAYERENYPMLEDVETPQP